MTANWNGTGIRWTDESLNNIHGCSKTSEGCMNCYAERVSRKFNHSPKPWTVENAEENINVKPHKLDELDALPGPRWVFVNSMSDLFHPLIEDDYIRQTWDALSDCPESAFQVLTKHGADEDREIPDPPQNVMLGVSVESQRRTYRIEWLRQQPAETKFISFEPLVEPVHYLDLSGIDWAIIGGESGPEDQRREMNPDWAREIIEECREQDVPVFFKKHSGNGPEENIEIDMQDGRGPRRIEEFPELPSGIVPKPEEFLEPETTLGEFA